jgi:hypothetical protein
MEARKLGGGCGAEGLVLIVSRDLWGERRRSRGFFRLLREGEHSVCSRRARPPVARQIWPGCLLAARV